MKTRLVGILVSFIVLNSCSTVDRKDNDLKKMDIYGKVKSIRVFSYEAVNKFGEILKGKRKIINSFSKDQNILFNEVGNQIEMDEYNSDGSLYRKYIYKYDDKRNRIEENIYKSDGSLSRKITFKYDYKGNQFEEKWCNSDGSLYEKRNNKYDKKGNQIEQKLYNSDGNFVSKNNSKFDGKGNRIEWNLYNPDGSLFSKNTSKYDDKGNNIEFNSYLSDENFSKGDEKITYKYNDKGNPIEMIVYNSDGRLDIKRTYEYEYDNESNWILQIIFDDKIPQYILEREIEYY